MTTELAIVYVSVERLIPYARNSRTHNDAQVAQIAASIREFGFTNPVLVDERDGIIAGHGRVLAARKLGMDAVPTIRLVGLTETQRRAYIIADNKLSLNAAWDEELLKIELHALAEHEADLSLTGFDGDELAELMFGAVEGVNPDNKEVGDVGLFLLQIEFDNEDQLAQAFTEAQAKGLKCKILS